mmetsp:Transcript_19896/g.60352  ORF Transcript_19896/g.60352 Transcript_19896/m.60352 type:complete len:229 (-) Transcript_19896:2544-3230(-)
MRLLHNPSPCARTWQARPLVLTHWGRNLRKGWKSDSTTPKKYMFSIILLTCRILQSRSAVPQEGATWLTLSMCAHRHWRKARVAVNRAHDHSPTPSRGRALLVFARSIHETSTWARYLALRTPRSLASQRDMPPRAPQCADIVILCKVPTSDAPVQQRQRWTPLGLPFAVPPPAQALEVLVTIPPPVALQSPQLPLEAAAPIQQRGLLDFGYVLVMCPRTLQITHFRT